MIWGLAGSAVAGVSAGVAWGLAGGLGSHGASASCGADHAADDGAGDFGEHGGGTDCTDGRPSGLSSWIGCDANTHGAGDAVLAAWANEAGAFAVGCVGFEIEGLVDHGEARSELVMGAELFVSGFFQNWLFTIQRRDGGACAWLFVGEGDNACVVDETRRIGLGRYVW